MSDPSASILGSNSCKSNPRYLIHGTLMNLYKYRYIHGTYEPQLNWLEICSVCLVLIADEPRRCATHAEVTHGALGVDVQLRRAAPSLATMGINPIIMVICQGSSLYNFNSW